MICVFVGRSKCQTLFFKSFLHFSYGSFLVRPVACFSTKKTDTTVNVI